MWRLIILVILTVSGYLWFKKILDKSLIKTQNNYTSIKDEYDRVLRQNSILKKDNRNLENTVEQTIALYDITKQLCKSLDRDTVFNNFIEQINKYIKLGDCKFIREDADLMQYKNYAILPLKIHRQAVGYLVASKVEEGDRDKFHILAQQLFLGMKRALLYQKVQELAITDSLTGVSSRRYCLERLREEIGRAKKFHYYFSYLMVDIDHFKDYNDHYGHLVGDAILREVSRTIKENIRQIDLVGRYGGEEFCIILPETDKEEAKFAAERIRQAIEYKLIKVYDESLKVTVSAGISTFPDDAKDIEMLIDKSDEALYQAKESGRNRVCAYGGK